MNGIRVSMLVVFLSLCHAQMPPAVRGRVEGDFTFLVSDYFVELHDRARNGPANQAPVATDGSFEFRDVHSGQYDLRLTNVRGEIISEQILDVHQYTGPISIRLPPRPGSRPGSGTVSIRELQRPIPEKAFHSFVEAQRYSEEGHPLEAARQLERALRIYPDYSDARSNLGVEYVRLGRWQDAFEQFEKAIASGPPSARLFANLAYALCGLGHMRDAEQAARHAVELDDACARGHYLLGSILARAITPQSLDRAPEAARHLRRGSIEVPHAFLDIARIYLAEGDRLSAEAEVRLYLNSGDRKYQPEAERWLANIRGN